jgi:hypothetical protein
MRIPKADTRHLHEGVGLVESEDIESGKKTLTYSLYIMYVQSTDIAV